MDAHLELLLHTSGKRSVPDIPPGQVRDFRTMLGVRLFAVQLARRGAVVSQQRAASLISQRAALPRGPVSSWHVLTPRRLCTGRSAADNLSDTLQDANLLLTDLVEDEDRSSEDFKNDLEELRAACARVYDAYEVALALESEASPDAGPPAGVKKAFELAVVGLRDKLSALEAEAA